MNLEAFVLSSCQDSQVLPTLTSSVYARSTTTLGEISSFQPYFRIHLSHKANLLSITPATRHLFQGIVTRKAILFEREEELLNVILQIKKAWLGCL
jgi:hypothetical protein